MTTNLVTSKSTIVSYRKSYFFLIPWLTHHRWHECTEDTPERLEKGLSIGAKLKMIWQNHGIHISTKIRLIKALIWPVVVYGCERWTLKKDEERRIDAFEMKCFRQILRVSWTAKGTNEWYLRQLGWQEVCLHLSNKENWHTLDISSPVVFLSSYNAVVFCFVLFFVFHIMCYSV